MVGLAVRPHLGAIKVLLFAWVCTLGAGAAAGRNWKRDAGAPAAGGLAGNTTLLQHAAARDICSSSPHSFTSELYTMLYAGCLVPSHPSIPCTEAPFDARIDHVTPTECAKIAAAAGQELFSLRRLGNENAGDEKVSCWHMVSQSTSPTITLSSPFQFGDAWAYVAKGNEHDAPQPRAENGVYGFAIYRLLSNPRSLASSEMISDDENKLNTSLRKRRSLLQEIPPLGSVQTIHFELQFDGLELGDRTESFEADYCSELIALTRADGALCFVLGLSTQGSSVFVDTGIFYPPDPVPESAVGPDIVAALILISPGNVFSAGFVDSYAAPTKSTMPVVIHVYDPPPPAFPSSPPRPPAPSQPSQPPFPPPFPFSPPPSPPTAAPPPPPSPRSPPPFPPRPESPGTPPVPSPPPPSPPPTRIGCEQMEGIEFTLSSEIRHLEASLPAGTCRLDACVLDLLPTASVSVKTMECVVDLVACIESRSTAQPSEKELLKTLQGWLECMRGGATSPAWGDDLFESYFNAVLVISSSSIFGSDDLCDAVPGVVSAVKQSLARNPAMSVEDVAASVVDRLAEAIGETRESAGGALAGYSDPTAGGNDGDVRGCPDLASDFQALIGGASDLILDGMSDGDTVSVGSGQVKLILSKQDTAVGEGLTFTFDLPGGGFSDKDRRRRLRHRRALAAISEEFGFSPDRKPEIAMPGSFSDACSANPGLCPQPLAISLSYTAESAYIMLGLGTAVFVSAAADYAKVSTAGLMVATVSGTMGLRLPFVSESVSSGLLGTSTSLHFPLDGQVSGTSSPSGKLCAKVDYELMRPVVVGLPNITDGVATCTATSAGDYLIIQLAYGLASPSAAPGFYTASKLVNSDPLIPEGVRASTRWKTTLGWACGVMALCAACIIAVMWLKYKPPPDEDAWMYEDPYLEPVLSGRHMSYYKHKLFAGDTSAEVDTAWPEYSPTGRSDSCTGEKNPPKRGLEQGLAISKPCSPSDGDKALQMDNGCGPSSQISVALQVEAPSALSDGASVADAAKSAKGSKSRLSTSRTSTPISEVGNRLKKLQNNPAQSVSEAMARKLKDQLQKLVDMDAQGRRDIRGRTALHLAIVKQNVEAVTALTQDFSTKVYRESYEYHPLLDSSMQDSKMQTPLHTAALVGNVQVFEHLLRILGDSVQMALDMRDVAGNTVVHMASVKGNAALIRALQKHPSVEDLNVDFKNQKGWTALQLAVCNGEMQTVVQLLKSNPNIDAISSPPDEGEREEHGKINSRKTALHIATVTGHKRIAMALLEYSRGLEEHISGNDYFIGPIQEDYGLSGTEFEYDYSTDDEADMASESYEERPRVSSRQAPLRASARTSAGYGDD